MFVGLKQLSLLHDLCETVCLGVQAFSVEEEISSVAVVMYIVKRALQAKSY